MDTVTGEISPEPGSRQSPSHSTRLCPACLSVLARDDLEVDRNYPHHDTLRAFVEASDMRCYVCSWLVSKLCEHAQSILRRLAKGTNPHHLIVEEGETTDTGASDRRVRATDHLRDVNELCAQTVPWVSFTTMRIEPAFGGSCYKILALHNPSYKGYFLLDAEDYDFFRKDYLGEFSSVWRERLIIISYEGISILTLTITR